MGNSPMDDTKTPRLRTRFRELFVTLHLGMSECVGKHSEVYRAALKIAGSGKARDWKEIQESSLMTGILELLNFSTPEDTYHFSTCAATKFAKAEPSVHTERLISAVLANGVDNARSFNVRYPAHRRAALERMRSAISGKHTDIVLKNGCVVSTRSSARRNVARVAAS